MALKLKYKDEHGILHINMSPSSSPTVGHSSPTVGHSSPTIAPNDTASEKTETDINDPKFDTINNRFGQYDLFGGKYEKYDEKSSNFDEKSDSSGEKRSLFRSRYNSIEEELANTPYAFATERTIRFNAHSPALDITISRGTDVSPSQDIEDDRFFHRPLDSLFGPSIDFKSSEDEKDLSETPAFTVTQLIHAQDRYFDLSSRTSTKSEVFSDRTEVGKEVRVKEDISVRTEVGKGSRSEKTEVGKENKRSERIEVGKDIRRKSIRPEVGILNKRRDQSSERSETGTANSRRDQSTDRTEEGTANRKRDQSSERSQAGTANKRRDQSSERSEVGIPNRRRDLSGERTELRKGESRSDGPEVGIPNRRRVQSSERTEGGKRESSSERTVVWKGERRSSSTEDRRREEKDGAFRVLSAQTAVKAVLEDTARAPVTKPIPVVPTAKRKREKSFVILAERPVSRPTSPRSLPVDINSKSGRVSPFRGRGFREETSRHTTPKTSAANSRACTPPPRRRTSSLSRLDSMATLPPPLPPIQITQQHTPRDFVKENIEEVRELSELNREKHEEEAERKRLEEEEALLKEMGLLDKNAKSDAIRSVVCSRTTSRSNSPNKLTLRSRSSSPTAPSILRFENLLPEKKIIINHDDGMAPVTHKSRGRSVSKSQPQSNDGSPKHSKIPKRQNSVSPNRKRPVENGLRKQNQRFISNSTSSIHETIRVGGQAHDKRNMSKSTQFLNLSPGHVRGKPPISPGRVGPPPTNRAINPKRLSPIVGTPNKSPTEDRSKPASARTPTKPSTLNRKPVKTAGNTPATSRFNSRQPSRNASRDSSPDKKATIKSAVSKKQVARAVSTRVTSNNKPETKKPVARNTSLKTLTRTQIMLNKTEPKKPAVSRQNSMKTLPHTQTMSNKNETKKPPVSVSRQNSVKNLAKTTIQNKNETKKPPKPPVSRTSSMKSLAKATTALQKQDMSKSKSTNNLDEMDSETTAEKKPVAEHTKDKNASKGSKNNEENDKKPEESTGDSPSVTKQDMETQYDKITNEKGELVIMTKKNIVSMTTAAITSQPLEVVTKVTNQLPVVLEKARDKSILERNSSKDSLAPTDDDKPKTTFGEGNVKLKPLLPPYNNPQVERVKQKIDDILKSPEVSTENIAAATFKTKEKEKSTFKSIADKTKSDLKDAKDDTANKFKDLKDQIEKVAAAAASVEKAVIETADNAEKASEKTASDIRSEASKIVDSIMTPIEEPKPPKPKEVAEIKKNIEPTVVVVNEKTNGPRPGSIVERMTETLVKGEPEVEVQSSNMSTPGVEKMALHNKMADGNGSDKSAQSNGGFPQSTSTTPKPPARTKKESKDGAKQSDDKSTPSTDSTPKFSQRVAANFKRCCACCAKQKEDAESEKEVERKETSEMESQKPAEEKRGMMSRLNCFKKKDKDEMDAEMGAGKASIVFESETKRKRKLRDIMCGCCQRKRRISDVHSIPPHDVTAPAETGCCGTKKAVERRDSILSDRPPPSCWNKTSSWLLGSCRRKQAEPPASRRQSMFSKNKSLSPTLPPEDTRTKLDTSLVEHTSMIRGAIPVLPIVLAYFCLFCNIIVPGLGTIFSGMFCLCFGIPRFGIHDGAKYRIGSFIINILVGCGQLFTVLFCLVGWGWSIWWGVIMLRVARKYRRLKAEAALEAAEGEAEAPPVTANNHTRA